MDLDEMDVPPWLRVFLMKRREHWVRSVYLLIEVHEEEAEDGRCGASASRLSESVPCIYTARHRLDTLFAASSTSQHIHPRHCAKATGG
jgi:hypothetical protein